MTNAGRAQALFIALTLIGCAGEDPVPQHVEWVRVDGKPLTSQFNRDSTACRSDTQKANRAGNVGPSEKKAKATTMHLLGAWPTVVMLNIDKIYADGSG